MNLSVFSSTMADMLPTGNMVYAVRMHGTFPSMKVRAIPAQHKPYPTLAEASTNQSVYTYSDTTGTVVGFYTPVFFKGINVAGYHLHFISDDRKTGGHILDLTVPANTTVEYDITPGFAMALPTSGDFHRCRSLAGPERGSCEDREIIPCFDKESFFAIETYRIGTAPEVPQQEHAMKIHGIKKDILSLLLRMAAGQPSQRVRGTPP